MSSTLDRGGSPAAQTHHNPSTSQEILRSCCGWKDNSLSDGQPPSNASLHLVKLAPFSKSFQFGRKVYVPLAWPRSLHAMRQDFSGEYIWKYITCYMYYTLINHLNYYYIQTNHAFMPFTVQ